MKLLIYDRDEIIKKIHELKEKEKFQTQGDFYDWVLGQQTNPHYFHHNATDFCENCDGFRRFLKTYLKEISEKLNIHPVEITPTSNKILKKEVNKIKQYIENAFMKLYYTKTISNDEEQEIREYLQALKTLNEIIKKYQNEYYIFAFPSRVARLNFNIVSFTSIDYKDFTMRDKLPPECQSITKIDNKAFFGVIEITGNNIGYVFTVLLHHKKDEKIEIDLKVLADKDGTFYILPSSNLPEINKFQDLLPLPERR